VVVVNTNTPLPTATGSGSVGCTAAGPAQALEIKITNIKTNSNFFIREPFFSITG